MSHIRAQISALCGRLFRTGFFSVFFSNVICKVLTFIGGMIIVRVLSKGDYGQYTYVMNCYGMLFLLGDLGCSVASMQFCNEQYACQEKSDAFFTYGYRQGMLFSGITALLFLTSPWFYPFRDPEAAHLTQLLCLMPFLSTTNNFLLVNLRVRLQNNRFAKINLFNSLIHYVVILPMSYWISVRGAVFSNYVISLLVLAYSLWTSRGFLTFSRRNDLLERSEKRSFLKLAFASQLNNGVDHALVLLDVFLIGIFIGENEVISSYKVATTIPSALAFIPTSVMVYLIPYFARHNQDRAWVRRNYFKLMLYGAGGNLIISAGCILLAPWLVPLIFGRQYTDAVPCFIILMIGYFFSATFRVPSANIIYTQRKIRVNIIITALSGCANCVLDVILILHFGSIGAAWATTGVHIINSALCFGYMCIYLKGAKT